MKTRNLLLALGCAAALTACTTNDEPNVAPAPAKKVVTLSVDVNEPADTRVEYEKVGTTYKFSWSENDNLRVFYNDGTEKIATFTIDVSSIDGKKADFTSEDFPEDYTGDVTIVYNGVGLIFVDTNSDGMENDLWLTGFYGQTTDVAADLAHRTLLYARADVTEAGKLPDVTLNHALSYLLLKKGLQVTQEGLKVGEGDTELLLEVGTPRGISFSSSEINVSDTDGSVFGDIYVTDGKLVSDCLVPLYIGGESGENGYYVSAYLSGAEEEKEGALLPNFTYEVSKIYVVEAGNEKWQPVTVAVPEAEVIDLSTVTDHVTIPNDSFVKITGGDGSKNVTVGSNSRVILSDASMNRLILEGDATFVLEGNNKVTYNVRNSTGIVLASDSKVIIQGPGTLTKVGGWNGSQYPEMSGSADVVVESGTLVIEGNYPDESGHAPATAMSVRSLTVKGGKVEAKGGYSYYSESYAGAIVVSEDVVISGGEVIAKGNGGIKAGGSITITDGTVDATSLSPKEGPIPGLYAETKVTISGGTVTAKGTVNYYGDHGSSGIYVGESGEIEITGGTVTATGSCGSAGIGACDYGNLSCGKITISGGTVTAAGANGAAGIGTSSNASSKCGDITIGSGVTKVTSTKGSGATDSIGKGNANSTIGTVTIEDGANVEQN